MSIFKISDVREKLKEALDEKADALELSAQYEAEAKVLQSQNDVLEAKIKALESLNNREVKTKTKELELDRREKLLEQNESVETELKKKNKELEAQIVKSKDQGYKEGYADGVSDGVRKGMDITAEDRKMMAQIAAIAAASHTPEATTAIAKEVANGIAQDIKNGLPATTGTANKKAK